MVALWPFSGPEGATRGRSRGRVVRGQEFEVADEARARQLLRSGKAHYVTKAQVPPSETKAPGPAEAPEEVLSVRETLVRVDSGDLDPQEVLAEEQGREHPRQTLITALEQRLGQAGGGSEEG